ncbi:hypothetical protein TSUD_334120 [Trifolium subterraneum]|uniref:Chalcone isomerase domain-containing protein n=1 Tax=Trifolium subterraneum TaxID=3900 RepID=A0A2Z6MJG1_TRISU|nr:hypothetical protein TSUD_334120 [Trifolium subterraneum]
MVSLRFPFIFSNPKPPQNPRPFSKFTAAAAAAGATAAFVAVSSNDRHRLFLQNALNSLISSDNNLPLWGCISLADSGVPIVDSRTGSSFPSVLEASQKLCGIGLRKKCILGLKNIDGNKEFTEDLLENDIHMTVRLQIVYGKLSIRSVRSAFEESVGKRLQKYGGSDNKELLQRFTSQFRDEIKIPRGSVINLTREKGHVLRTTIDGEEVGSIQSKLLCRSILDLYVGEEPFDKHAKEEIELNIASYLQS